MLFMVIEHFEIGSAVEIYRRAREQGRMLPQGLVYVDSWVEANVARCFQLMECDDARLIQEWALRWSDLAHFEIVPVVPARQTAEVVAPFLPPAEDLP